LAASDGASAQDTDALVVQRMPFPPQIGGLKDGELFFWWEMRLGIQGSRSKHEENVI